MTMDSQAAAVIQRPDGEIPDSITNLPIDCDHSPGKKRKLISPLEADPGFSSASADMKMGQKRFYGRKTCSACGREADTLNIGREVWYDCPNCDFRTKSLDFFRRIHFSRHHTTDNSKCKECCFQYANIDEFFDEEHVDRCMRKYPPTEDGEKDGEVTEACQGPSAEIGVPTDQIWRKLLKRVLRKWDREDGGSMPQTVQELLEMEDEVRDALYEETMKVLQDHHFLVTSPIFKKIEHTKMRLQELTVDEGEAFRAAWEEKRWLLTKMLRENTDVIDDYEADDDDEDEEKNEDDAESKGDDDVISSMVDGDHR